MGFHFGLQDPPRSGKMVQEIRDHFPLVIGEVILDMKQGMAQIPSHNDVCGLQGSKIGP